MIPPKVIALYRQVKGWLDLAVIDLGAVTS
jgi:hypothetical protein